MTNNKLFLFGLLLVAAFAPAYGFAADDKKSAPKEELKPNITEQSSPTPDEDLTAEGELSPYTEADREDEEKQDLEDVEFSTIESFGILEQAAGQGLGRQFYNNSKRSVMTALIQAMPQSDWNVMQDLGNQVLLTAANAASIANDIPADPASGQDLLTLRIEKLMERGFTREAYTLYTRLNVDPFNEKIARLGLLSMFINGQKPLACVEMKTFDAPFKTGTFWDEMDAYCMLSLAGEPLPQKQAIIDAASSSVLKRVVSDKSYRVHYTPKDFEAFSLMERALLVGENRIDISTLTDAAISKIPAQHIQPLLALENISNKTKILLNARGLETGVISPYEFARMYIRIGRKAEKEKTPLTGLEHIATLYWKRADTFLPESRAATVAEILTLTRQNGTYLLVPFLEELSKGASTDSLTLEDMDLIIQGYFKAGMEMPAIWLDVLKAKPAATPKAEKRKEILMIASALMSGDKGNSPEKLKEIYDILEKPQNSALVSLKNIIENIDNRTGNYAKVRYVYEKGFDLGTNKSYTMPPASLIEQLELSSKSHATGETVLLCNLILQGMRPQTIYPGILGDVARALSEVGLGKQAQRLLAEVVLSLNS